LYNSLSLLDEIQPMAIRKKNCRGGIPAITQAHMVYLLIERAPASNLLVLPILLLCELGFSQGLDYI
jgi:hypothetical protein